MEFIKSLIFGRKIYIEDAVVGRLDTRVKSENPSIEYTWTSEHQLSNQKEKTVFILEGNIHGPSKKQLEAAYRIVNELDSIIDEIDSELSKEQSAYTKVSDWKDSFYFAALSPYEDRANEFEINFEPFIQDDTRYVGCIWSNGRITEVEGK